MKNSAIMASMIFRPKRFDPAVFAHLIIPVHIFFSIIFFTSTSWSEVEIPKSNNVFTFYWENDAIAKTDRNYTNGLKLTWSTHLTDASQDRNPLVKWGAGIIKWLPFVSDSNPDRSISISLGQNIYTPEDTSSRDLILNDRPYAGWLYLGTGFHSQNDYRRDIWELNLGMVGPSALGESAQVFFHDIIDSKTAKGWDHQLNNELGVEIIIESKWRLSNLATENGFGFDFIHHLGSRFGNVTIYANTGAELRLGWHVPNDFGSCPIRPGCDVSSYIMGSGVSDRFKKIPFSVYMFMGVDGRAVLRDIFLDGNTFQDSHSVDKELLVADVVAGFALNYRRLRLSYAYIYRTKEFKSQIEPQIFGSFTFSFAY